jgi:hypothetical protein
LQRRRRTEAADADDEDAALTQARRRVVCDCAARVFLRLIRGLRVSAGTN